MYDQETLIQMVEEQGYTCAIAKGETLFTSKARGIRPLLDLIEVGRDVRGGSAADRIVGKAAALLYAHMGIAQLYAGVLGEKGLAVLRKKNISVRYGVLTPRIINREGTDICPMERAAEDISDPERAYTVLKARVDELAAQHKNSK